MRRGKRREGGGTHVAHIKCKQMGQSEGFAGQKLDVTRLLCAERAAPCKRGLGRREGGGTDVAQIICMHDSRRRGLAGQQLYVSTLMASAALHGCCVLSVLRLN
jgi:hypothetical protein